MMYRPHNILVNATVCSGSVNGAHSLGEVRHWISPFVKAIDAGRFVSKHYQADFLVNRYHEIFLGFIWIISMLDRLLEALMHSKR